MSEMLIALCRGDRLGSHTPANVSDAVLEEAEEIPWKLGIGKSSGFIPVDLDCWVRPWVRPCFVFFWLFCFAWLAARACCFIGMECDKRRQLSRSAVSDKCVFKKGKLSAILHRICFCSAKVGKKRCRNMSFSKKRYYQHKQDLRNVCDMDMLAFTIVCFVLCNTEEKSIRV